MNPVTQNQLKDLTSLSKQAISKACRSGHITMVYSNGRRMVDLDGFDTVQWLKRHTQKTSQAINEPIKTKTITLLSTPDNPSGLSNNVERKKLQDEKLEVQIEEIKIKNDQKRADLIPKRLVVNVFNKIYSIDENQLKPIGVNVMPKISSVYNESNSSKVKEILEYLGKKDDKNLKSEILKILNSSEDDRIIECNQILEDEIGSVLKNIQRVTGKFLKNIERMGKK